MEQRYPGVVVDILSTAERRVPTGETATPLVIRPLKSASSEFLSEFLASNSPQILADISRHGALLMRGFEIDSDIDFEKQLLSIRGVVGMREILFSEPGRTLSEGTQYVFSTNTLLKTGGALKFGMFHSENYFTPDVPQYISFFCRTPSALGGETGLINTSGILASLPDAIKRRFEESSWLVSLVPITEVVHRYGVRAEEACTFIRSAGLPLVSCNGVSYVAIYKPSVIEHPITRERSLAIGFDFLNGITKPLVDAFSLDYRGSQWLLHRLFWNSRWFELAYNRIAYRRYNSISRSTGTIYLTTATPPPAGIRSIAPTFSTSELQILSTLMRRYYSSFLWRRNDVLILDNLKIAHNGMAGLGDRELLVMLCNPLLFPTSSTSPGVHVATLFSLAEESLGAKLARIPRQRNGQSVPSQG